jgi:DNA-binding NtrC family response regulator
MAEATEHRLALLTENDALWRRLLGGLVPDFELLPSRSFRELVEILKNDSISAVLIDVGSSTVEQAAKTIQGVRAANGQSLLLALAHPRRGVSARLKALGADEVLPWNSEPQELQDALRKMLLSRAKEQRERQMRDDALNKYCFGELVGGSEPMRRVYEAVCRVAATNTTVMIRGESGTGKELVARAI